MNPRHHQFVAEYLIDLNATAAYRRVYPRAGERSARQSASDLLAKPDVKAAIQAALAARSSRTDLDAAWVLGRLRAEALDRGESSTHGARVRALELLGKHLGMFVDRVEVANRVTLEVVEEIVDAGGPQGGAAPPRPG